MCVCVYGGGDIMGCLPPDLFVCVSARARGVCSVRGERERRRRRAHTLPHTKKHGNIFKLNAVTKKKQKPKELPSIDWQSK